MRAAMDVMPTHIFRLFMRAEPPENLPERMRQAVDVEYYEGAAVIRDLAVTGEEGDETDGEEPETGGEGPEMAVEAPETGEGLSRIGLEGVAQEEKDADDEYIRRLPATCTIEDDEEDW